MKRSRTTLQERMVRMATRGFVYMSIEYDPDDKLFEVWCENPSTGSGESWIKIAGDHLELLLAMSDDMVAKREFTEADALAFRRNLDMGRITETRCPRCKLSQRRDNETCWVCGAEIPREEK